MATLKQIVRMLEEQRRELLDQLNTIDRALTALGSGATEPVDTRPDEAEVEAQNTTATVQPKQFKARRVLSDSHKHALITGKRKAREAQDAAKGLAREMPDDAFVPAIGSRGEDQPPRLVKEPAKK